MQSERCTRCKPDPQHWKRDGTCSNCGVHKDRRVMSLNSGRRRNLGGKRGRNSGKVSQHGKKG
jgi:hypothetical protein